MGRIATYVAATLLATPLLAASGPAAADPQGDCAGRAPTIVGTAGDDVIRGGPGRDVVIGLGGDDTIRGLGGDDLLCGGEGTDVVRGGAGNDLLLAGLGAGVLSGGAGDDRLIGSMMIPVPGLDFGADGQGVAGGSGRDSYFMRFVLEGAGTLGDATGKVDLRHGVAFADDGFRDVMMPVTGIEQVEVTRGRWTLVGGALDETLLGSTTRGAHVDIHAGGGRDVLRGTLKDNLLDGGRGVDTVLVTAGDDTCVSVERFVDGLVC